MGRLVKANPTTEASKGQTTVVGTGAHGRLVRTGDVQRTSPAGNAAKQPTVYQQALDAAAERANELDKLTTPSASRQERANEADKGNAPSASRQAKSQSFGERVLKAAGSGLVGEGANLANLGGVVADKRDGTEMSGVYRRQAETLDKQIAALEKTLQDPTMTAQDIRETNDALAIARSERAKYGKVIESGEKTGKSLYETADKGYSFAQKLSDESLSGTKGIQKGALKAIPAATQIGAQTAERMIAPGLDMVGRAASVAGANAADYRHKAGAQYDAEKASLRATVAALGVAAGGALSKGVNASGLKLLRAAGAQNRVLPNILLGGTSAVGYAAGETGASELSKAMTDENYTPDWNAIGETALTAFAFGAVTSAINAAAITGRNKRYMNELNDAAKERYDYAKRIIEDPRATAEQKAAGAQSVMDAVDKMRYTLDDLQVVGAQKEVDAMREFLLSIYGEMLPYTNVNAGGIGAGASAIAPTAPSGGVALARTAEAASPTIENTPSAPISPRAPGAAAVQRPTAAPETAPQQVISKLENAAAPAAAAQETAPQQAGSGQNLPSAEGSTLDAGKRVPLDRYATKENADQISQQINDGTLAVDAQNKLYRVDENEHIDRRDSVSVGDRKVNAFQFDHPELHQYFADAAADLAEEMSFAQPGGELVRRTSREAGDDEYIRTKRGVSERVARLLDDEGVRYEDIDRSISAIIHNHGQENFAAAKRVELMLDEMLTNGYTDIHGRHVAPNEAYIAAKRAIPGATEETTQTREELPIYDMPNAGNGGIYEQNEPSARGAEPTQTEGRRADAVAAQDNLYGGDRGRGAAEPGTGGTGKLRRQTEEDRRNRALIQQRRERAWQQPLTSAAVLGVQGGTSEETLHVLPESEWDEELRGFSDWARGKGVKRVTMVTGLMQVETESGAIGVRGVINRESGEMVLRVDNDRRSAAEIGRHEVGHFITEEENVRAFMDAVRGGGDWQGIYDAYEERYASLTANYIGMTEEQRALYVWEEILEDAYAGLDSYGQQASRYHEQAVSAIESAAEAPAFARSEPEGLRTRAVDEPRSRGPPERYSTYIDGEIDSKSTYEGIQAVAEMQPVAEVSGTEFGKGEKDLITQVTEFFDSIGNEVYNPQLGDIMLTRRGAKSDVAHGIGRKKAAAFAAVPDVLKKGRVIDYQVDWKGRNYDTAVVAAPITIAGEPYIAGVVLTRANSENRFYVHEVLTEKGTAPFKTGESPTRGVDTGGDVPSIFSLLDKVRDVKRNTPAEQEMASGEAAKPKTLSEEIMRQLTGRDAEKYSADDAADKYLAPIGDGSIKEKKKGISLDEALEALDAQRGLSYRFYGSDNPMSRAGYAMFADDPDRAGAGYGGDNSRAFSVRDTDLTDISDLRNKIIEARHETDERMPWVLEDHSEVSDDDFANLFDPEDIVDSAGAYDDEDLTAWLWENILGPNGVKGIKTYDGAIVFEPDIISRNLAAEVAFNKTDAEERLSGGDGKPKQRFSAEDEDGGDAWSEELARMPENVQEAVQRVKERRDEEKKQSLQEFPNLDAYLSGKSAQRAAERAEKLRNKSKDEFDGTEALKDLGVKIENSAGDYSNVKQLIENDRAAKAIRRETRKAIKRLGATPKEQNFALNIASGLYDESDIPPTMNRGKVEELADYFSAEQSMSSDFIRQRRAEINETLEEKMKDLFDERFEGEFTAKAPKKGIAPDSGFALYHRTPQRSMRAIFGWDRGQQINEAIFEPVYTNEQERKRFVNRMHDEVRTFKDKDGKESALTERERALTQLAIEGKAVDEMVGKSELKQQIIHAAENMLNGAEMKEAAQEFGLHGKDERELAQRYADWLRAKEEINGGDVDRVKIENAAAEYSRLYDKFYAAINDFLVAHGYEPIGFIKGYAPHFQPEAESTKLESALKAIGVDLGAEVGKLPASIAGLTKSFKPNKRYNPFFQHRKGESTEYDVQKGFEKYVDYLSDVLYHTDDIMRTRAAAKHFRKKYAPDEISTQIEQAENLRYAPPEEKELYLKTHGIIDRGTHLSYEGMNEAVEKYTESLFDDAQHTTKYGDLVTWLDDYANKLAGKQLFNDRSMEREVGRTSLNVGRKMVNLFARANVAGNLSSALNQTAQLPMIAGELGPKYVAQAVGDIIKGETKGDFAERSDFLTEKHGIDYLTSKKGDKVMEALFWPLERMDYLISSIAVRGKYRKEISEGKSEKEALRAADRWGRDMMGSRSKGTAPLTFQSKNLVSQMVNLFQVEALNSWEHVTQDLFGPGLKEMEAKLGKKEAARRLAGTIIGTLLGAFLLNRLDEELYGGTPAQFDVLGLLTGFLASGNGLSTNEQLGVWVDDVWQKMTGERLFGTDEDAGNDQFNLAAAAEDTLYNVSSDIPYVRNVSGILGLGDQTLPMPDLYGTASGIGGAVSKAASGDYDNAADFWGEVGKQIMGLAGDTLPGGRQAEKTLQGTETLLRGGTYSGYGDNAKLQYPVTPSFSTVLQSTMFGRNALSESRDYYASGMGALSVKQTQVYRELVEMGADQQTVYDAIQGWRKIDKDKSLSDGEREAERYELVSKLPLTNEQKVKLHDELANSSKGYAAAQEAEQQGISMSTYAEYKDATAGLTADKDENGNSISGSKKQKVIEEINKMPVNAHQKDWLYLQEGYSQKDLKKMPWNQ